VVGCAGFGFIVVVVVLLVVVGAEHGLVGSSGTQPSSALSITR
jgi:hypothetical protein